jgi:hypothetical protein
MRFPPEEKPRKLQELSLSSSKKHPLPVNGLQIKCSRYTQTFPPADIAGKKLLFGRLPNRQMAKVCVRLCVSACPVAPVDGTGVANSKSILKANHRDNTDSITDMAVAQFHVP